MSIKALYLDFFRFLDQGSEEGKWKAYRNIYLNPHKGFFDAHWAFFEGFDLTQIAERVEKIKKEDYGHLHSLILEEDPIALAKGTIEKCRSLVSLNPEPDIYLFVGFFSADGKTLEVQGRPAIALGLERFRDFKDLPLLLAHEYCHCAERILLKGVHSGEENTLLTAIIREGLAAFFTEAAYPQIPLYRHLFITPERLQWCEENREAILDLAGGDLTSEKLVSVLFGSGDPEAGLPPRIGYFLAREMVGQCLTHQGRKEVAEVFPGFEKIFESILDNR